MEYFGKKISMSLRSANALVLVSVLLLVSVTLLIIEKEKFTVMFDSNGGEICREKAFYSNKIQAPDIPQREGYRFVGWYKDAALQHEWNFENDAVTESMTLYAGWEKIS